MTPSRTNERIKRPSNSYMLYRSHELRNTRDSAKKITERWNKGSSELHAHWERLADVGTVVHKQKYPDYEFHLTPASNGQKASSTRQRKQQRKEYDCLIDIGNHNTPLEFTGTMFINITGSAGGDSISCATSPKEERTTPADPELIEPEYDSAQDHENTVFLETEENQSLEGLEIEPNMASTNDLLQQRHDSLPPANITSSVSGVEAAQVDASKCSLKASSTSEQSWWFYNYPQPKPRIMTEEELRALTQSLKLPGDPEYPDFQDWCPHYPRPIKSVAPSDL